MAMNFHRERFFVFTGMFWGWFLYYFCRKCYVASMPDLTRYMNLDKTALGTISSSFTMFYGVSKFVSGVMSDTFGGKILILIGLMSSGVCCLLFPITSNFIVLAVIWGVCGYMQGLGWPGCAKILRNWYAPDEITTWWAILSAAGNVGAMVAPIAFAYIALYFEWEVTFYLSGVAALITGVFLWLLLSDSPPKDLEKPSTMTDKQEVAGPKKKKHHWYQVMLELDVWVVSLCYLTLGLIRHCVSDWSQLYFIEEAFYTETQAATCVGMYQAGGVAGTILIGYLSDRFIKQDGEKLREHPRAPAIFLNGVFVIGTLHMLSAVVMPGVSELLLTVLQFIAGGLLEGGTVLVGVAAMDCVAPELAGSSHAMAALFAQIGAFYAGLPFSFVIKIVGWSYAFLILESVGVVFILLASYLLIKNYSDIPNMAAKKQQ